MSYSLTRSESAYTQSATAWKRAANFIPLSLAVLCHLLPWQVSAMDLSASQAD